MHRPITSPPPTTSKHRYVRYYRIRDLRIAYDFVREHSEIKKLAQKAQYDKNTSNRKFVVGDLVWVQLPSPQVQNNVITRKLRPKYQGPCLLHQIAPTTFIVQRLSDNVNLGGTNVDRMKLYYVPLQDQLSLSPVQTSQSSPPTRRFPIRTRRPPIRYE